MLMNDVYDSYIKNRLIDVALGRTNIKTPKVTKAQIKEIVQVHDLLFEVMSESKEEKYFVDMEIGICDCPVGQTGAVCKHQTACAEKYMLHLPQQFKNTLAYRQWLVGIALGRKPSLELFTELQESAVEKVGSSMLTSEEMGSFVLTGEEVDSSVFCVLCIHVMVMMYTRHGDG